jgi:hypothetical protein
MLIEEQRVLLAISKFFRSRIFLMRPRLGSGGNSRIDQQGVGITQPKQSTSRGLTHLYFKDVNCKKKSKYITQSYAKNAQGAYIVVVVPNVEYRVVDPH